MALFKACKGKRENLPSTKTDGYAYFCVDDGTFWIDYKDENGVVQRKQLNAKDAETLMGASLSTILNDNEVEIPTSKAVLDAINSIDIPIKTSDLINDNVVQYTEQTLIDEQKAQARTNIGAQQKIYNLVLENPIVENQTIADNSTFTLPSTITLAEGDLYWADIQFIWTNDGTTDKYQIISKAVKNGSVITVSWNGAEIVLSTTGITTDNIGGNIVITLAKVVSYEPASDIQLVHQEGTGCVVSGIDAHVEGYHSNASGCNSHAEGDTTTASNYNAHAEGSKTIASGNSSHSEGYSTTASGEFAHAEGSFTIASDSCAHAEGHNTSALDECAHAEGKFTTASGWCSHAEGRETTASDRYSHAEGYKTTANGQYSHAEGHNTTSSGEGSHTEGYYTTAYGSMSHAEGFSDNIVPETITSDSSKNDIITAWGTTKFTLSKGSYSHTEGWSNLALGSASHAEGKMTIANGNWSHTEGIGTETGEDGTHAEGWDTKATDYAAHSEGRSTVASGKNSHSEGYGTTASGESSHAEGSSTVASGSVSHAEGEGTFAAGHQHVEGKYNEKDIVNKYAHVVGNGTSDTKRSNAHTLDWDGNAWFAGKISVGTITNVPTPLYSNDLVTKKYVDNKFATKSVTLAADSWTGTESPYSQQVTIDGVTENSKVDLNPSGEQLNSLAANRTILNTANDNGTVTVYAIGNKPTESYTMQATITEV